MMKTVSIKHQKGIHQVIQFFINGTMIGQINVPVIGRSLEYKSTSGNGLTIVRRDRSVWGRRVIYFLVRENETVAAGKCDVTGPVQIEYLDRTFRLVRKDSKTVVLQYDNGDLVASFQDQGEQVLLGFDHIPEWELIVFAYWLIVAFL